MLIVGKFKDYYDGAVGMGIDKTIVYERHLVEMVIPKNISEMLKEIKHWGDSFTWVYGGLGIEAIPKGKTNTDLVVVGFCGKLYVGIKITKPIVNDPYNYKVEFVYDHDKIVKVLKKEQKNRDSYDSKYRKSYLENYENYVVEIKAVDPTKWFIEYNTPIFVYGTSKPTTYRSYNSHNTPEENFFINPKLKDYGFVKVFDPYMAFQEIQMYVSGVLGNNEDGKQPKMSEKQKVAQHGMDKWSFRKEPKK